MITYSYIVEGLTAGGNKWSTIGAHTATAQGEFANVPMIALRESFAQLTQGKAVFGNPGLGCQGPYRITRMLIEELPQ